MKMTDKPYSQKAFNRPQENKEKWLSKDGIVTVPTTIQRPDPADTAQEPVHEVMPKADVPKPKPWPSKPPTVVPPSTAAKGDDDLMSKQQQASMPSADELKGKWKQQVGAAKIAWGKLTEDELLKSEGHAQKLAGLVQERYAVTRDEADKQIKTFFDKN